MTHLFNGWVNRNVIEGIAFKELLIIPRLPLQKLSKSPIVKHHLKALWHRLDEITIKRNLVGFLEEGMAIPKSLKTISLLHNIGGT